VIFGLKAIIKEEKDGRSLFMGFSAPRARIDAPSPRPASSVPLPASAGIMGSKAVS
jgi:hypothetical protein